MRTNVAGLVAVLALASGAGSQPAAQAPARQSFSSTATAILVDVVVRDRKGLPVTDLVAADFEIAEDGVAQKVDTFTRVTRGGGIGVGIAWRTPGKTVAVRPAPNDPDPQRGVPPEEATTALVFDHLSADSLRLAQRATLDYVPMTGESGVRVGVFATDPGVRMLQPYTNDRAMVRNAVSRVMPAGSSTGDDKAERSDELIGRRRELEGQARATVTAGAAAGGVALAQSAAQIGERETELNLIRTEMNMLRAFDSLDRSHKGYDTTAALMGVVQTLSYLPGRKTIVFFSEGLPVTPALSAKLDDVIAVANRANVTAYAIDAKGLRSKSLTTNARKEIEIFAEERLSQIATGTDRTEQPLTMAFERVEDTIKLDSRAGLARLAEDTGGFLIEQTNDLTKAFRRIDEDNQFHYLLTYSPKNTAFDGKFRAIQVKVRRPGTHVFARKGYRAVGAPRSADTGSYETPAVALLDRTPLPNAFPVHAAGFSFPDPARPGLTPVLVHVATGDLHFNVDRLHSSYSAQAAVVVRIRDSQGREVQKLSQQYVLAGDAKDVEAAKNGDIIFYREPDLPAGTYTMETIVFDAISGLGSARVSTLTIPPVAPSTLGMSSLVVVSKVEEVGYPTNAGAPLYVGRLLVYPNLGEPIKNAAAAELSFYYTVYGGTTDMKAYAQLLRNGAPLAEAPMPVDTSNTARAQQIGRLPIGSLPAGTYELRIRVTDGGRELSRGTFFTIQ